MAVKRRDLEVITMPLKGMYNAYAFAEVSAEIKPNRNRTRWMPSSVLRDMLLKSC